MSSTRTAVSATLTNRWLLRIFGKSDVKDGQSKRSYHEVTGDVITPSQVMGIDHLRDPRLNKVCLLSLIVLLLM